MVELELTNEEATVLQEELNACIEIAAEAEADGRLRALTAVQMKLNDAIDG